MLAIAAIAVQLFEVPTLGVAGGVAVEKTEDKQAHKEDNNSVDSDFQ